MPLTDMHKLYTQSWPAGSHRRYLTYSSARYDTVCIFQCLQLELLHTLRKSLQLDDSRAGTGLYTGASGQSKRSQIATLVQEVQVESQTVTVGYLAGQLCFGHTSMVMSSSWVHPHNQLQCQFSISSCNADTQLDHETDCVHPCQSLSTNAILHVCGSPKC